MSIFDNRECPLKEMHAVMAPAYGSGQAGPRCADGRLAELASVSPLLLEKQRITE